MATVPERARNLMSHGKIMALATASADGEPNVVPMQQCWWYDDDTMVIGDFFMKQTRANVQENGRASFTVWQQDPREGYKYTGTAQYLTAGTGIRPCERRNAQKAARQELQGGCRDQGHQGVRHQVGGRRRGS